MSSPSGAYFIGVDVGTASVRAVVVSNKGHICGGAVAAPITIFNPQPDHYEQSSDEIWTSCCKVVREAVAKSGIDKSAIKGIGFDATCSLVVLDSAFQPVSISSADNESQNDVIMWMDHRSAHVADRISKSSHRVLEHVGGSLSPEMSIAKIAHIAECMPDVWQKAKHYMELPDYLSFRATGSTRRGLNSLVCKWGYAPREDTGQPGWDESFFEIAGLKEIVDENYKRFGGLGGGGGDGSEAASVAGEPLGSGLTKNAAEAMGLETNGGIRVGGSVIDAYAGVLGTIAAPLPGQGKPGIDDLERRVGIVCGTSSCLVAFSKKPIFVRGVWGPYVNALFPNLSAAEPGQSATGRLLDHVVETHPAIHDARKRAKEQGVHVFELLSDTLTAMAKERNLPFLASLANDVHVNPDFHGNRAPLADPSMRGAIVGLTIDTSLENLAMIYLAILQALAYETKHIIDTCNKAGHHISSIFLSGGLCKNKLSVQIHASVLGLPVALPHYVDEAVPLGSAILGAAASGCLPGGLWGAASAMGRCEKIVEPAREERGFHDKKARVLQRLWNLHYEIRDIMK